MNNINRNIEDIQDNSLAKVFGNGGVEKHERYNWDNQDDDGNFRQIDKYELDIDLKYQREGKASKIRHIARHFSWTLFGTLTVVEDRQLKKLFVVDGGHRLRASMLRADIKKVPCMVFQREGISEEARIFFEAQTVRSAMSAFDRHKAGLVAEHPISLKAQELVERHGYDFSKHSGEEFKTSAIFTLYKMIERNSKIADVTFDILSKVAQGATIQNNELKGLFYLISMNPSVDFYGFPLNNMAKTGLPEIQHSIIKWKNATGFGGEKQFALGMIEIINKGRSKNKVIVPV